jgi:glycosyltransferase involved in cell wall biosynthesis
VQIELLDFGFLLPDLRATLARDGFLVAASDRAATVDVFAPDVPSSVEASARITASANRWGALRGVPLAIRPPAGRIAHPSAARSGGKRRRPASEPTVSIALPVFNGEPFLAGTLDSLLAQSFADFELIICDNASEDGTREICEAYAVGDDRVRYLRSDVNRGAAWNYNRGFDMAAGRYFKWASHDDLCAPTYLERCVEVLDRAPDSVVLAYPKTVLIDEGGHFVRSYEDGLDLRDPKPHRRLRALIRNLVLSNAVFGLIRRDALERTRGHGSYISADYILLAELALLGQFWEIPEPLFLRREHPQMSRRANRSTAELAEWFETGSGDESKSEFVRLFAEYVAALDRAPLTAFERMRAYTTLLTWLRRFHRSMLRELVPGRSASRGPAPFSAAAPPHIVAERIVVHDAVREALWSVAPDYSSHLQVHVDPRLAIETDRGALNTILVNLISNAVRYGRPPIVISAELAGEFSLTIHDEGRGVSRDFQPRLFEPFSRSSESEHSSSGLGLGLAIAAMSAEENSGSLTYEGQGPGACFRLVLPQSPRIGDPPQIRRMPARSPQPSTNVRLLSAAV